MADYGMTDEGWVTPTFEQLRDELKALYREEYGEGVNLEDDSLMGIDIAIRAEREALIYQTVGDVYSSSYPTAVGVSLDRVMEITNVQRLDEEFSTAVGEAAGTPGTLIPAGRVVQVDSTLTLWATVADATIGGGGTIPVEIQAIEAGPVNATTLDTYTIMTPVSGWSTFEVTENADLGRLVETDAQARVRREDQLAAIGSGSLEAMAARLREVEDVDFATIEENKTDATVNGVAAHGFRAVVLNGADADIRQCIFDNIPLGTETSGAVSGSVVDSFGNSHTIKFSRPSNVNTWVNVTGTKNAALYPSDGDARILAIVTDYYAELAPGDDVMYLQILQRILDPDTGVTGILTLVVQIGASEGTETAANFAIAFTEQAVLNDLDISIT